MAPAVGKETMTVDRQSAAPVHSAEFRTCMDTFAIIRRWLYAALIWLSLGSVQVDLAWAQVDCPPGSHIEGGKIITGPDGGPVVVGGHCVKNPPRPAAGTIFVDWQNSGLQDGTAAHPYQTLAPALAVAAPGDAIVVRTGSYNLAGGLINKSATIRAENGPVTIISRPSLSAQNVLTNNNNNARTGFYPEFQLDPATVNASAIATFGKIFSWPTDGQIYTQPLYMHGVRFPDGGIHNVVFVATETNHVYAFDADNFSTLWDQQLGSPVLWEAGGCHRKNLFPKTGITSTPVIDVNTETIDLVARTRDLDGSVKYRLHALDLGDGHEKFGGPVTVGAAQPGFDPKKHLNRPGLLLSAGRVYLAFGSECDTDTYHGWIFAHASDNLVQVAVFNSTPTGERGGIWQAGRGLAGDATGNLYVMTGNGTVDFDHQDVGESFLRLSRDLALQNWFTPREHACWNHNDLDLGSSGPLLLPSVAADGQPFHLIGGGKPGWLYLLSSDNLGGVTHFQPLDAILATKPLEWVGVPCASYLNWLDPSSTHHIHGGPALWPSRQRALVYNFGENDPLKAFEVVSNKITFVASSKFRAPPGMPGGILSVSGVPENTSSGLVWATVPLQGDASEHIVRGMLVAFQAEPNGPDLPLLWHSEMNAARDSVGLFAKFAPPTIADSKVFVASFGDSANSDNADNDDSSKRRIGRLHVYGLLTTP
jgi:hypothetical protein